MNWTENDIKKLKLVTNIEENVQKTTSTVIELPKIEKISVEKQTIKKVLWVFKREGIIPNYVEELQFNSTRKFRFDWAIPELKIAIEYEGIFSKKSGHTTVTGYTKDCEKYNIAAIEGWIILRYTAKNYNNLATDLKKID
jgi:hypothetical protein